MASRKDRLDRVNDQLKNLYGPLLASISAADSAWTTFRQQYRPQGGHFWKTSPPPTDEEGEAWRLWIRIVFMPLNRQMRDLIVANAHLFDEEQVPECLLKLSAHVSAYEPMTFDRRRNADGEARWVGGVGARISMSLSRSDSATRAGRRRRARRRGRRSGGARAVIMPTRIARDVGSVDPRGWTFRHGQHRGLSGEAGGNPHLRRPRPSSRITASAATPCLLLGRASVSTAWCQDFESELGRRPGRGPSAG